MRLYGCPLSFNVHAAEASLCAGETIRAEYQLEYGSDVIEMSKGAVKEGQRVLLLDDLIATGGTMAAGIKLMHQVRVHEWRMIMSVGKVHEWRMMMSVGKVQAGSARERSCAGKGHCGGVRLRHRAPRSQGCREAWWRPVVHPGGEGGGLNHRMTMCRVCMLLTN